MDVSPVKSYHKSRILSIVVGFNMLRNGQIDALASAGNTGAVLTGTYQTLKPLPGIMRPCISVEMPLLNGKKMLISGRWF